MANTTTAKSTVKVPEVDKISELEKENKEIKEKLEKLMALLEAFEKKSEQPVCVSEKTLVEDGPDMPEEPSTNKTIRILSLCRGSLNLSEDNFTSSFSSKCIPILSIRFLRKLILSSFEK